MQRSRVIFAIIMLLGAVLWNGWVFGFYNHGIAGYLHMSISELEVVGQPNAVLFNVLEDGSGLCMILGVIGLIAVFKHKINLLLLILICIGVIGGLTLYDVDHPLDCNSYNNIICLNKDNANHVSKTDVLHNDESRLTAYITIGLAILIVVWAHVNKLEGAERIGLILIAFFVVAALAILDTNGNILVDAISERIWNVLVSLAIGYIAVQCIRPKPRMFKR